MKEISRPRKEKELDRRLPLFVRGFRKRSVYLDSIDWFPGLVRRALKILQLHDRALRNSTDIYERELEFEFDTLPVEFDGLKICFISDLHIDGVPGLRKALLNMILPREYDICLMGGDYCFKMKRDHNPALREMKKLLPPLLEKTRVLAVLGNHDEYVMGIEMENIGAEILVNDSTFIERNQARIYFCGMDDCHFYLAHDLEEALSDVPPDAFRIMLSHSPELYPEAEESGFQMYLAGHTHGGQICLPGKIPLLRNSKVPAAMLCGSWQYRGLKGYTSCGAGSCLIPARLNCPPEIAFITLRKTAAP